MKFIGYSSKWNQSILKEDLILVDEGHSPSHCLSSSSGSGYVSNKLYTEIKRQLKFSRKNSPEIVIKVDCSETDFNNLFHSLPHVKKRNFLAFDNNELSKILPSNWNMRIKDRRKNFSFVVDGTAKVQLRKKRHLTEFIFVDGKLNEKITKTGHYLTFTFVRGDGT